MLDIFYSSLSSFQEACRVGELSDTALFVSGEYFMNGDGEVLCTEYYGNSSPFIQL